MQLFGKKSATEVEKRPDGRDRLPVGQYLTKKWPVLSYESTPKQLPANWKLKISGLVEQPFELNWEEFLALPRTVLTADFHCVTTWSRYDNTWEGVHIREILRRAKPLPQAQYVMAHSWTGYTTNLPFADLNDDDVLIAIKHDGNDLEPDHGGPVRLIVPKLYAYKSAKWLDGLEFMERDHPRLLGAARLSQPRRPLAGRTLLVSLAQLQVSKQVENVFYLLAYFIKDTSRKVAGSSAAHACLRASTSGRGRHA